MTGIFCLIVFIGGWLIFWAATVWVGGKGFIRFARTFKSDLRNAKESGDRLAAATLISRMVMSVSLIVFITSAVALLTGFAICGEQIIFPWILMNDFSGDVLFGEHLEGLWLPFVTAGPIITIEVIILDSKEGK